MTTEFIHRFLPASDPAAPPLLLLHGTGGNEDDLLPLGPALRPGAALLSPRGKVLERGMPRFFRRLAEGVFDEADLRERTAELAAFVGWARGHYRIGRPVAVGLSNGANVAGALLLLHPGVLAGAALIRPMVPLVPETLPDLRRTPVLLLAGRQDTMVAPEQSERLAELLRRAGAEVELQWQEAGHALRPADVETVARWMLAHDSGFLLFPAKPA